MGVGDEYGFLEEIAGLLRDILAELRKGGSRTQSAGGEVATDAELSNPKADETLKARMPRDWSGPSYQGKRMSECPPELLDLLADRHDYFAEKADQEGTKDNQGHPKSKWERLSAKRARGWARRIRSGWQPPSRAIDDAQDDTFGAPDEGDIPF